MAIHIELKIVKGIGPQAGDTGSAEQQIDFINLLDSAGFGVEYDGTSGWTPNSPQLKNNGLYADSAIADGATLLAAPVGNVTETMRLHLAGSAAERAAAMKKLSYFTEDMRNFWETNWQIEPVYLKWYASAGAGPQYALIYDIQVASRNDPFGLLPFEDITLVIVREPYWRGIAPGDNPKKWTFEFKKLTYANTDLALNTGTDSLIYAANVQNRHEFDSTNYPGTPLSQNYIDILAANIPGDAPALVELNIKASPNNGSSMSWHDIWVGRLAVKPLLADRSSVSHRQSGILNAGDGTTIVGDTTKTSGASGVLSNASNVTQYYVACTFATLATDVGRLVWGGLNTNLYLRSALQRGTYACYLRHTQIGGAAGNVQLHLVLDTNGNVTGYSNSIALPTVNAQIGVLGEWCLAYMGQVTIMPSASGVTVAPDGRGIQVGTQIQELTLTLYAKRNTGAATLNILDLVLIPADEPNVHLINPNVNTAAPGIGDESYIVDNTGYFTHGQPEDYASVVSPLNTEWYQAYMEAQGQFITLQPGVDNRLFFFGRSNILSTGGNNRTAPAGSTPTLQAMQVRGNIVPRWAGIRDI